jgi:hypothetical protein
MMTPSGAGPALSADPEPRLDKEKLLELLGAAHEHEGLDYKRQLDLSENSALLELVKDIAAFSAAGGYLVVGCDDSAQPSGLVTQAHTLLFDESRLRAKVRRYLPEPLTLRAACHEHDGARFVLVYVGPHPDGFVIVKADGQSVNGHVFRRGDVFVRHGTASERWDPHDFAQIKQALINSHVGVPELVPAPPSTHRVDVPRLVQTGDGPQLYQRIFLHVENVGPAIARIGTTTVEGYDPGVFGRVRPPTAIAPSSSRPFELNAFVAEQSGLTDAELMLNVRYEGGGRQRDLLATVTYDHAAGFDNVAVEVRDI